MIPILADSSLPELDLAFPAPFEITRYHNQTELQAALSFHHILLCRSTLKVNEHLLKTHRLDWVLTASSGRDHLDDVFLSQQGTQILDAKGSNATAVVDYVLSSLAYLQSLLSFAPKTIGVIGIGEVGGRLVQRLSELKFNVLCFDPLRAQYDATCQSVAFEQLMTCDLLCLHPNLHHTQPYPSYHLINSEVCAQLSQHSAIINASRGHVVDEDALLSHYDGIYCTDVYANEPHPNPLIIQRATLCTPHIAGHTQEAKSEAVRQLSRQLHAELGLRCPKFPTYPTPPSLFHNDKTTHDWQTYYLSIYNPLHETQQLKTSIASFQALRANHLRYEYKMAQNKP